MYDGKEIKLPIFDTYEKRLKHIEEKIFSNNDYRNFYGIVSSQEEKLDDNFAERWLGMKKENSDSIDYHVRNVINYLTTYLTGAKELSANNYIKRYFALKVKYNKGKLNKDEKQEFEDISNNILFLKTYPKSHNKDDIIFFINTNIENIFKNKKLDNKFDECEQIKKEVIKCKNKINYLNAKSAIILSILQDEYKFMKSIKDKEDKENIMDDINRHTLNLKYIDEDIELLESRISDLCSDYKYLTEYK